MFERFTTRARAALACAQAESKELGHNFLGTEHLLLGLLHEPEGVAGRVLLAHGLTLEETRDEVRRRIGRGPVTDAEALRSIGIDLDDVIGAVEATFGPGALDRTRRRKSKGWGGPPFTARTKKVLELSLREAVALGHSYIGTEHLLLGILRAGEGVAADVIASTTTADLRAAVLDDLRRLRPGA
jgi:ATP-dependent Clp protease ATP-binding subunit ClpA